MSKRLIILIVMIFSAGCDSSHILQKHLQEYQERMANVLDIEQSNKLTTSLPSYPPRSDLKQNISDTSIKLFEFYKLKHCELYSLVAERNTTLGNLQLPSTRYIYERQLIAALQQCIKDTSEPKLREKLTNWHQTKVQQLPMVWADLIQLSSEIKQAFSANFALVQGNQQDGLTQTKEVLSYLIQINQKKSVDSAKLEQHLRNLMYNPLPAKLWLSQRTLTQHLNHSTNWLVQHTNKLQCSGSGSDKKIEYLTNVFQQFFIKKIQPIASQINHYHYQLNPIFDELTTHPHLSSSFKEYIQNINQQGFENYQAAMQQHIQFWQGLFKRCNIQPYKSPLGLG